MNALSLWLYGFVVNAVWQVPLLYATAWVVVRLVQDRSPLHRHRVWVGALVLQLVTPALPIPLLNAWAAAVCSDATKLLGLHSVSTIEGSGARIVVDAGAVSRWVSGVPQPWVTCLACGYLLLILCALARTLVALTRTMHLRQIAAAADLSAEVSAIYGLACAALGRRPEQQTLLVSTQVAGPMTLGIRKPAILVPPGLLEALGQDDLRALFAHELAHVARGDFARNLLYRALLLPLAFHPIAFRTLGQVAETREMICDDLASKAGFGDQHYARSLLRLATLLVRDSPVGHLHAIGLIDANSFERRVMRLTTKASVVRPHRLLRSAAVVVLSTGFCTAAVALHLDTGAPISAKQQADPGDAAKVPGGVMAGQKVSGAMPMYPPAAKADKIGGTVKLHAIIGGDGSMTALTVLQSVRPDIDMSAVEAVKTWRYRPYLANGKPVSVDTVITVTYNIGSDSQ